MGVNGLNGRVERLESLVERLAFTREAERIADRDGLDVVELMRVADELKQRHGVLRSQGLSDPQIFERIEAEEGLDAGTLTRLSEELDA